MTKEGRRFLTRALALAGIAISLSACGFKLRGQQNYVFKQLTIVGAEPSLATRIKRFVEAGSDTRIVETIEDADAVLRISESRNQGVLARNSNSKNGTVQEYQLDYTMEYALTSADGTLLIAPSAIVLNRGMLYNTKYQAAKELEASLLYSNMQDDAASQIMRRLSTVHSLRPAPTEVQPSIAPLGPPAPPF
ncbi:LPS assembly lipoprotein LptE [Burkholderia territorii]|uniref:LPS-assembly lipoprotein LptE n=1 Tax=Burkholderia territorii TaxID=1503055 RepID=UPI0009BF8520|nr:LPS assembly lipoprotein LptE [Burkholderia territorii]